MTLEIDPPLPPPPLLTVNTTSEESFENKLFNPFDFQ